METIQEPNNAKVAREPADKWYLVVEVGNWRSKIISCFSSIIYHKNYYH